MIDRDDTSLSPPLHGFDASASEDAASRGGSDRHTAASPARDASAVDTHSPRDVFAVETLSSRDVFAVETLSSRDVFAVAGPMTLGYMTTPLVGLVATTVVGRLGDAAALGGVAFGSTICDIVFSTLNFLRSGTTGLTAQAVGRGNGALVREILARAFVFAAVCGFAVALFAGGIVDLCLAFLGGSDGVREAATSYALVRLLAAPLTLANNAVFGWFLGRAKAAIGLGLQTLLNLVNIALSIWFVTFEGDGVRGVALAAVIAEAVTLLAGIALVAHDGRGASHPSARAVFSIAAFAEMGAVNRDIMIRSFVLLVAFAFFSRQGAAQGDVILAANAVLGNFYLLTGYFLDGVAAAAEVFVGRAIGAGDGRAFRRAVALTTRWAIGLAVVAGAATLALGAGLIGVMTTEPHVAAAALRHLPWAAATPVVAVVAFQMDGVFIGATWSRDMAVSMVLSAVVFVAAWAVLFPRFGNDGLWMALLIFLGARGVTLWFAMKRRMRLVFGDER